VAKNPDGSSILRHEEPAEGLVPAVEDPVLIAAVEQFMEQRFGKAIVVWHELVSHHVHIDVHMVRPTEAFPVWILFTTGMSGRPMSLPEGAGEQGVLAHAELMMALPPTWAEVVGEAAVNIDTSDERKYWPIRMLKGLARLPHEFKTWLSIGHTIPNGNPPSPYSDDVPFDGVVLMPPLSLLGDEWRVRADDGREVQLLVPIPLYPAEMDFKLKQGLDALLGELEKVGVSEVVDAKRACSVGAPKAWWKWWN
jgi:hypothetical protein